MLSLSKLKHIKLLKGMADVHGIDDMFDCCTYRSERESRHSLLQCHHRRV